jgi:ABC-type glycerol-3-phosphate transport system substrate-binding protein
MKALAIRKWGRVGMIAAAAALALGTAANVASASSRADPVTLTVWDWSSPAPNVMKQVDDAFTKQNPGIVIKRVHQPFNSYFTLLRTAVATRKGPDIFENYASPLLFDYYAGLTSLAKYRTPEQKKDLLGWSYVSSSLSPNGTPYAMPWTGQGIHFYYNKALFKKAGLDPNTPPTTWAQFLAACEKLKAAGITPINAGWKDGYLGEWWIDVLSANYMTPAELVASGPKPNWQSPAIVKAFGLLQQLVDKGYMTKNAEAIPLFPDAINNFGAGKAAFMVGLAANNANWSEFSKDAIGKNLGAMLPPLAPNSLMKQQEFDYGPAISWSITKWSKNADPAYKYFSFLATPAAQVMVYKGSGAFPNNSQAKVSTTNPVGNKILGWVRNTPTYVGQVTLIRANVEATFDKIVPQVLTKQLDLKSALSQIQDSQTKSAPIPTH